MQRDPSVRASDIGALRTAAIEVEVSDGGRPVRHTWKRLITIGKAKEGLHADVQERLRYVQQRCPSGICAFTGSSTTP
ncbi:hypothetical protein LJK88_49245 [Paenibacillus sp. P26]|nr:hypothetical protein LJK88_49245 [Paenibacillus sp. P26]